MANGRGLVLAVALATIAFGEDLESQNFLNVEVSLPKSLMVQLQGRIRLNHNSTDYFWGGGGPTVFWLARKWLTVQGGYLFLEQESGDRGLFAVGRVTVGGTARLWENERVRVTSRTLLERFQPSIAPDFTRYRQQIAYQVPRRAGWAPYVSGEVLRLRGVSFGRYAGGARYHRGGYAYVLLGYEWRPAAAGPATHMIVTQFNIPVRRERK